MSKCTVTVAMLSFFVLVSVVAIHLLFSSIQREKFESTDVSWSPFKLGATDDDLNYLKKRLKPLNTNLISDVRFLRLNPSFVKDVLNTEYAYFYSDNFTDCNYNSFLVENVFAIYMLESETVTQVKKCVLQIKIERINPESVKQFVEELKKKSSDQ